MVFACGGLLQRFYIQPKREVGLRYSWIERTLFTVPIMLTSSKSSTGIGDKFSHKEHQF